MRKARSIKIKSFVQYHTSEGSGSSLHPDMLSNFHVLDVLPYEHIGQLPVVFRHVNIINTQQLSARMSRYHAEMLPMSQ